MSAVLAYPGCYCVFTCEISAFLLNADSLSQTASNGFRQLIIFIKLSKIKVYQVNFGIKTIDKHLNVNHFRTIVPFTRAIFV